MDWVSDYIGLPFREMGRGCDGCDCWGLVRLIYAERAGLNLPDYLGHYEGCDDHRSLGDLIPHEAADWIDVPRGEEQAGDVLVLRMRGVPMHTAMVVGRGVMIHVHSGINTVLENYNRPQWTQRVIGIYRHPEFNGFQ